MVFHRKEKKNKKKGEFLRTTPHFLFLSIFPL